MVQIWCFIVINLVAALERTSLSKPAVLCAVTWPRYPELSSLYKLRYFRDSWGVYRLTPVYPSPFSDTPISWINGGPRSSWEADPICVMWPMATRLIQVKGVSLKSCVGSESQRFRRKTWSPNGKVYCLICLYTMEKDWVKCAEVGLWDKAPAYRSNTAEEMQQARGGFWLDWRIQPCTLRKVLAVQTCPK